METIFKCRECGLFIDAAGERLPIPTAARMREVLELERNEQTPPATCRLCEGGDQRIAAALKQEQGLSRRPQEEEAERGRQQLPAGDRE